MKNNLKELKVWKKAIDLTVKVYKSIADFFIEEQYILQSQMRRAVVLIPSNIVEGAGRNSRKEFNSFLGISNGSSYELMTQFVVSNKLNFIPDCHTNDPLVEINALQKMTIGLKKILINSKK
jgi:four helix bundle protein